MADKNAVYQKKGVVSEGGKERYFMQKAVCYIKENKWATVVLIVTFFVALLYNGLSPYTADDYSYMFSAVTGEKISNIVQIIVSLMDDYLKVNGRVLPHFFVQLFMIFPKWVFNIANAAMYVGLIWLILHVTGIKRKFDGLLWAGIAIAMWVLFPAYGQVFLWMTGSINYSWSYVFALSYLYFYWRVYLNPSEVLSKKQIAGLSIYSFLFGAYSAQVSFATVFVSFVVLCILMYSERTVKKYIGYVIPVITAAVGYLTMILSPAETGRLPEMSTGGIFKRVIDVFETYYMSARVLLIVWAILLVFTICFKVNQKEIVISTAFVAISVITMGMLGAASYVVARHYTNSLFFLLVGIVVLMQSLLEKGNLKVVPYCICAYMLMANIWTLWEGTYDIYDTYRQHQERESYIYEQRDSGNGDEVYVPMIIPLTKYSCKYDLTDLQIDDTYVWPNSAIAKYYGIGKIYGIR